MSPVQSGQQMQHGSQRAEPITCLIVDDHEIVREGLRLTFSRSRIRVVGEAADGESAIALAARRRPDVVVMDVRMGSGARMDGLDAAREILAVSPNSRIVIFTGQADRHLLTRGRDIGCAGYVDKSAPHTTIVTAVEHAAAGKTFVDPTIGAEFVAAASGTPLSNRELEILQLIADGASTAAIATQLFVSQETVKSHVASILAKLGADSRTRAVAIALRENIID
jgi:DNA-binding NarL/FixJ family response regulator